MDRDEIKELRDAANAAHREAEKAWYAYFCRCEIGPEREAAAEVFENIRTATRVSVPSEQRAD